MTANYTKVRTHAKTIGIINEFFQKYRGRTSYIGIRPRLKSVLWFSNLLVLSIVVCFFFGACYTFGCIGGCEENIFWNLDSLGASAESPSSLFRALYIAYGSMLCLMLNSKP